MKFSTHRNSNRNPWSMVDEKQHLVDTSRISFKVFDVMKVLKTNGCREEFVKLKIQKNKRIKERNESKLECLISMHDDEYVIQRRK